MVHLPSLVNRWPVFVTWPRPATRSPARPVIQEYGEENKGRIYSVKKLKTKTAGTSLAVQWLRLQASTAEGIGSIPG